MRPLIAGNWKMHGLSAQLDQIKGVAVIFGHSERRRFHQETKSQVAAKAQAAWAAGLLGVVRKLVGPTSARAAE